MRNNKFMRIKLFKEMLWFNTNWFL